ncbi:MAG: DUF4249 family protein [Bacteroidales bacterium]|nr:DUF4249 family protein [Bacteroidales bacterium]
MKLKLFSLIILVLFVIASCEQVTTVEIDPDNTKKIAVECLLTSEYKFQTVKITRPFYEIGQLPEGVLDAQVIISDSRKKYIFAPDSDSSGLYVSEIRFAAILKEEYNLQIILGKDTFAAQSSLIAVTPIGPVPLKPSWRTDSLFMIDNAFVSSEEAMWEVVIDWSGLDFENDGRDSVKLYYYTFNTIDVNQVFAPNKEIIEFPIGAKLRVKKYALTSDHAKYYRAVLSEVEWSGGFFDVSPANIPTNISNDAVGYFGACTVTEDSILVQYSSDKELVRTKIR